MALFIAYNEILSPIKVPLVKPSIYFATLVDFVKFVNYYKWFY